VSAGCHPGEFCAILNDAIVWAYAIFNGVVLPGFVVWLHVEAKRQERRRWT
jgi:hypothetical protein